MAGRKINDMSSMFGKATAGENILPMGAKTVRIRDSDGAGEVNNYPDMEGMIHSNQEMSKRKVEGHKMKPGYRN
jgi:hypothetical protein